MTLRLSCAVVVSLLLSTAALGQSGLEIQLVVTGGTATAVVPGPTGSWTLELERVSYRAPGFQVLIDRGAGPVLAETPEVPTWRGRVKGASTSFVSAAILCGELHAWVTIGADTWTVKPSSGLEGYSVSPSFPAVSAPPCGHVDPQPKLLSRMPSGATPAGPVAVEFIEVAYDLDYDWLLSWGFNEDLAIAQAEILHALAQPPFEADPLNFRHTIEAIVLRTQEGVPYAEDTGVFTPDLCDLRDQVEMVWSAIPGLGTNGVQLLTQRLAGGLPAPCGGVVLPDTAGGIAYIGEMCDDTPYSVVLRQGTDEGTAFLMAHEWGHLWNAVHCCAGDCETMCSPLVLGCAACPVALGFGAVSSTDILAYKNAGPCQFEPISPVIPVPQLDVFQTSGSLTPPEWTFARGGSIVSQFSPTAPSPPNVLSLSTSTFPAADVRTGRIDLSAAGDWRVEFFVLPVGAVAATSSLRVQYLRDDQSWADMLVLTPGNFLIPDDYLFQSVPVPDDAFFDAFRVRFLVSDDGLGGGGSWTIDNFEIRDGLPPCSMALMPTLIECLPDNAYVSAEIPVDVFGTNLAADAVITFGSREYDLTVASEGEYLSPNHVRVFLDATPTPPIGTIDVSVSQCGGVYNLDDGFRFHGNFILNSQFNTGTGPTMTAPIFALLTDEIGGLSFGVEHGPAVQLGAMTDPSIGSAAEGAATVLVDIQANGWTYGVILADPAAPMTILPGFRILANPEYDVLQASTSVTQEITAIPPVTVVLSGPLGEPIVPGYESIAIGLPALELFQRADANQDAFVDIADVVSILEYLFIFGVTDCLAALDANDSAAVDISDSVYLLNFLFVISSPAPPPPFGICGSDFSSTSCDFFTSCP